MAYDFSQLSSLDFEDLCRDLFQAEIGERLETFKPGKDQGVDIRLNRKNTYVQCKHYLKSGLPALLSKLKKDEVSKVKKLSPERYIICTSLPLGKNDKAKIKYIFEPFIKSEEDIFGQEDLNNLLNRHKEIETQHFKLWLSSTAVLDKLLNNAVITKSEQLVERVRKKLPLFVQNNSFSHIHKIIKEHHIAIISGEPGVGKTTLAEMLIYHYLAHDFRPIEVGNPKDAYDLYNPEIPTIYYFDDFLGLTYLGDNFSDKESTEILQLIELIQGSKKSRMILTSREYILSQASMNSERFSNSGFLNLKYRLDISLYTKTIKAKILYNHLFFSELDDGYIEEIISSKSYNTIIQHKNYSPRIIEWMTKNDFIKDVPAKDYPGYFLESLNNPRRLWEKPFQKQISDAARHLLLVLLSMGGKEKSTKVQRSFDRFHYVSCKKYGYKIHPTDFNSSVKELLGGFLSVERDQIIFANPSLKDYVELWVLENKTIIEDYFDGAVFIEQLEAILKLCQSQKEFELVLVDFKESISRNIVRLKESPPAIRKKVKNRTAWYKNDLRYSERIGLYIKIYACIKDMDVLSIIDEVLDLSLTPDRVLKGDVDEWVHLGLDFSLKREAGLLPEKTLEKYQKVIIRFISEAWGVSDFYELTKAIDCRFIDFSFKDQVKEDFLDFLSNQVETEITEQTNLQELEEYMGSFEKVVKFFDIDGSIWLEILETTREELQEMEDGYNDSQEDYWKEERYMERNEQNSIDSYFEKLSDR